MSPRGTNWDATRSAGSASPRDTEGDVKKSLADANTEDPRCFQDLDADFYGPIPILNKAGDLHALLAPCRHMGTCWHMGTCLKKWHILAQMTHVGTSGT